MTEALNREVRRDPALIGWPGLRPSLRATSRPPIMRFSLCTSGEERGRGPVEGSKERKKKQSHEGDRVRSVRGILVSPISDKLA